VHRPVHREGRKFFLKNFFAPRGELGRRRSRGNPEFLGVFPKIQRKEAAKIELKSDLSGALLEKNPQEAVNHGVMNRGTL